MPETTALPGFGPINEVIYCRKVQERLQTDTMKEFLEMHICKQNRYLKVFTEPLPSGIDSNFTKFITEDESVVLRSWSHSATTYVYDGGMRTLTHSTEGDFGLPVAARYGKLVYILYGKDTGWRLDIYDIKDHQKLYTLKPHEGKWETVACCMNDNGELVVSVKNKQLIYFDKKGKCVNINVYSKHIS